MLVSCSNPLLTSHGSGSSRTVVNQSFYDFLSIGVFFLYLEFCNRHCRDEFLRTSGDEFQRTPRFLCFDGRRMFSLRDWKGADVHDARRECGSP